MKRIYQFYRYHVWSYEKLLTHLIRLPKEKLYAEYNEGFKSIPSLLVHIYNTDHYWLEVLNEVNENKRIEKFEDINSYKEKFKSLHISKERLENLEANDRTIEYYSKNGKQMSNTVSEILLTIVNHGTYHRGNISTMLRQVGVESISKDYAFYLREIEND